MNNNSTFGIWFFSLRHMMHVCMMSLFWYWLNTETGDSILVLGWWHICGCRLYSKFHELQVQYNGHASPGISDASGLFSVIEDQFYKASAMCQSTQHHTLSKNPQSSATWHVFFQERVGSQNSLPLGQRRKDSVYPQRQEQDSFLRWTTWHGREANFSFFLFSDLKCRQFLATQAWWRPGWV